MKITLDLNESVLNRYAFYLGYDEIEICNGVDGLETFKDTLSDILEDILEDNC